MPAAGIYVHLPYCRSRCGYCAFVVSTEESSRRQYMDALVAEASLASLEAESEEFDSIYLGGGTPSLTPPSDLERLLAALKENFRIADSPEVTLEANPDDVTPELADVWRAAGVNRISVGVQSMEDRELAAVGRRHDAERARGALELLVRVGFSVSADLILGLPEQTGPSFRRSWNEVTGLAVEHLSVYLLETDKSKVLEEDRRLRPERYLGDDEQADLWIEMGEALAGRGLLHYEISNWSLPACEARHNLKYWERRPTLGLGVSAHELWRDRRRANVSSISGYIELLGAGRRPVAFDRALDPEERERESIVLGLRLSRGVPAAEIESWIARSPDARLSEDYQTWKAEGWLAESHGQVRLTERAFLVSNEILCRFA